MKHLYFSLLLVLFVSPLLRADDLMAPEKPKTIHYLTTLSQTDELALIPAYPFDDKTIEASDLAAVLKAQAARTPDQIAEAKLDQHFTIDLVTKVIGPDFTAAKYPATFALVNNTQNDVYIITGFLKDHYKRLRPYAAHPDQVKALFTAKSFSYPSGHASGSEGIADVLGLIFPDKKQALLDRALAIAQSRVIAGVHNPSDIEQGKELADKILALLQANPAFQKDLAAAQTEVKK